MSAAPARSLEIAVRAFPRTSRRKATRRDPGEPSGVVVVFDTETRTDVSQRLLFGSYRVYAPTGRLVEEGLIAADDLSDAEQGILQRCRALSLEHRRLRLLSRHEFVERILWGVVYRARSTLVGFNLFYDESRLALGWRPARGALFDGGESAVLGAVAGAEW